jgi:hypothetical protein
VCHLGHPGRALMGASCAGQPDIFWEEWLEAVSRGAAFRGTIEAHSAAEIQHSNSGLITFTSFSTVQKQQVTCSKDYCLNLPHVDVGNFICCCKILLTFNKI